MSTNHVLEEEDQPRAPKSRIGGKYPKHRPGRDSLGSSGGSQQESTGGGSGSSKGSRGGKRKGAGRKTNAARGADVHLELQIRKESAQKELQEEQHKFLREQRQLEIESTERIVKTVADGVEAAVSKCNTL